MASLARLFGEWLFGPRYRTLLDGNLWPDPWPLGGQEMGTHGHGRAVFAVLAWSLFTGLVLQTGTVAAEPLSAVTTTKAPPSSGSIEQVVAAGNVSSRSPARTPRAARISGAVSAGAVRIGVLAECSTGTLDTSFSAVPISGTIEDSAEVDCYALPAEPGDWVQVWFRADGGGSAWLHVVSGASTICTNPNTQCALVGAGPFQVQVGSSSPDAGAWSYSVAVRRLTNPQGCASLGDPAVWSFTAPRINAAITEALGGRCYTFSRAAGEDDGAYWFRTVRTTGTLFPRWRLFGPSGAAQCSGTGGDYSPCTLMASGQFTLVVDDSSLTETGSFFLTAKRVSSPAGCAALPSIAFGVSAVTGNLSTAGEIDCYSIPDVSNLDVVRVDLVSQGQQRWAIVDQRGVPYCFNSWSDTCSLSGTGDWSVLVYDYGGSGAWSYSVAVRRLTNPQGCASLGDP